MKIDKPTVAKIAKLARLHVTEEEKEVFARELSGIFTWIEQLQSVNTEGVQPMAGVGDYTMRLREDVVNDGNLKDAVLKNAPEAAFDCYVVPKVVE